MAALCLIGKGDLFYVNRMEPGTASRCFPRLLDQKIKAYGGLEGRVFQIDLSQQSIPAGNGTPEEIAFARFLRDTAGNQRDCGENLSASLFHTGING